MIRPAKESEFEIMDQLQSESVFVLCDKHYDSDFLQAWVGNPRVERFYEGALRGVSYYVYEQDNTIVGYAAVDWRKGLIDGLFTHPAHASKGIGSQLLKFIFEIARQKSHQILYLESSLNVAGFYTSQGFKEYERGIFRLANGLESTSIRMKIEF